MKASYFSKDIQDFISLLAKHEVRYLIVGGEAVIYYGNARLTGDVDFFYDPDKTNALRLYRALSEFWDNNIPGLSRFEELSEPGIIIQFGSPPHRIDLLTEVDGITFEEAWINRNTTPVELEGKSVSVYFIGLDELIKNKEAMKRPKDLEDLKFLLKARDST